MRINEFISRMVRSKSKILANFGQKWASKSVSRNLRDFEEEFSQLVHDIKERNLEKEIEEFNQLIHKLIDSVKDTHIVFDDATVQTEALFKEVMSFLYSDFRKLHKVKTLSKEEIKKISEEWKKLHRQTISEIHSKHKDEYNSMLRLINSAKEGGKSLMEQWTDFSKTQQGGLLSYLFMRHEFKAEMSAIYSAKLFKSDVKKAITKLNSSRDEKEKERWKKQIMTGVKGFYQKVQEGVDKAHHVVKREVLYLFAILDHAQRLLNLERKLQAAQELPSQTAERIEKTLNDIIEKVRELGKTEADVTTRADRMLKAA